MDVAQVWVFIGKGDICAEAKNARTQKAMPTGWSKHWRKEVALSDLPEAFELNDQSWSEFFLGGPFLDIEWHWQIIVFVVFCSCRWFQLRGYGLWCLASVRTVVLPMSKTTWQDSSIIHSPFPGNGNIRWSPSYLRMSRVDSSASSCKLKAFEVEDQHVTGIGVHERYCWMFLDGSRSQVKVSSLTLVSLYTHVSQASISWLPISAVVVSISTLDVEPCGTVQLEQWQ